MGSKLLPDELWDEIAELFPTYEPRYELTNDRIVTAGIVRDIRAMTFCDALFSCREVNRFFGIELDWGMAAQMV